MRHESAKQKAVRQTRARWKPYEKTYLRNQYHPGWLR
jgi:hypothetical protein